VIVGRAAIELHRIATDVRKIPDAGLIATAKLVKRVADEEARTATGDGVMNGKHRRPIKLRARDKSIRPIDHGRAILITGVPAGPWVWITSGTASHTIRRRKRGPMRKMTVHHPGTRGRDAWTTVIKRSTDLVPRIFTDLVHAAVR
jgi:hypothetical protein